MIGALSSALLLRAAVVAAQPSLQPSQALSLLLAVESFTLSTVGLTATLAAPGRRRVARLGLPPLVIGGIASGVVLVAAVGAATAWCSIYVGGSPRPVPEIVIASCVAVAVVAQPALAIAITLGLRTES